MEQKHASSVFKTLLEMSQCRPDFTAAAFELFCYDFWPVNIEAMSAYWSVRV